MAVKHVFVGFGFGPIQSGLFAKEAADSGRFDEIVVAEVDAGLVEAVRRNGGRYALNVAYESCVRTETVEGVTLLNPGEPADRIRLRSALARATEVVTSLPSVDFYARGGDGSVARQIAEGLAGAGAGQTVIYTAENNNQAAEILEREVAAARGAGERFRTAQFLNTVIGKMSQVVGDPDALAQRGLAPVAPGLGRAFLVEAFNRILVSRIRLAGFEPGIRAFEEKDDLLPFEEAKLFGHNAAHTMLGFLGALAGAERLSDLRGRAGVMALVRRAFVEEVGAALTSRHAALGDPLFTEAGFRAYADDLLARMTNPHLADTVARATRDPARKLGCSDRLFGAIRLCLREGVQPEALAVGAWAGLRAARSELPGAARLGGGRMTPSDCEQALASVWGAGAECSLGERRAVAALLARAQGAVFLADGFHG